MKNTIRIFDAIDFVTMAHNGQIRKTNGMPKIVHLYGTAMLLSSYNYSEDLIIAGLLHDLAEDCKEYSISFIEEKFGKNVARYVSDVTEPDKSIEWKQRKLIHIEHLKKSIYESKVLCSADKINNLYSLENDINIQGEDVWKKFNASKSDVCWYYSSMCDSILSGYENMDIPIFNQLKSIVNRVILGGDKNIC